MSQDTILDIDGETTHTVDSLANEYNIANARVPKDELESSLDLSLCDKTIEEDQSQESGEVSVDDLSEIYTERRISSTEDGVLVDLHGVYQIEDSTDIAIIFEMGGKKRYIAFKNPFTTKTNSHRLKAFIRGIDSQTPSKSGLEMFTGSRVEIETNELGDRADIVGNDTEDSDYRNAIQDIDDVSFTEPPEALSVFIEYLTANDTGIEGFEGVKGIVSDITPKNEDKEFDITVMFGGTTIEFPFSIDERADPDASESARLIEHLGQGGLDMIEQEPIYVYQNGLVPDGLVSIGSSKNDKWVLVTPTDVNDWIQERKIQQKKDKIDSILSSALGSVCLVSGFLLLTFWFIQPLFSGSMAGPAIFVPSVVIGAVLVMIGYNEV